MFRATKVKSRAAKALIKKIDNKTARVGVIGLGYVGLPLSMVMAEAGFRVTGLNISAGVLRDADAAHGEKSDGSLCPAKTQAPFACPNRDRERRHP